MPLKIPFLMAMLMIAMVAVALAFAIRVFVSSNLAGSDHWQILTILILLGVTLFLLVGSLLRSDQNAALTESYEVPLSGVFANATLKPRRR